jgi:hypothetical protein
LKRQINLTIPKLFRGPQGQLVNPEKNLALPLDLFATSSIRSHNPASPTITIAYAKLANFLKEAEKLAGVRTTASRQPPRGKKSLRQTKKRKRVPTPPEELSSDTERRYSEREAFAEGRQNASDEDYVEGNRASVSIDTLERETRQSKRSRVQPD